MKDDIELSLSSIRWLGVGISESFLICSNDARLLHVFLRDMRWKLMNNCLNRGYLILLTVSSICIYTHVAKLVWVLMMNRKSRLMYYVTCLVMMKIMSAEAS